MSHRYIRRIAPAGRMLRAGGSVPPKDPTTVANLFAHYQADTLTGLDGTSLGTWPDSTAAARDITQATLANQPVIRENALNGKRVVEFDPSVAVQYLTSAAFTLNAQPNTVFMVAKTDALGSSRIAFDGAASNRRWAVYLQGSTSEWRGYAGAVLDSNFVMAANTWYVVTVVFDGSASDIWVGDGPPTRGSAGTHSVENIRVGAHHDATLGWDGAVAEVIVYDARVSDNDIAGIISHLKQKWAI